MVLFLPGSGGHLWICTRSKRRTRRSGATRPITAHDGGDAAAYGAGTYSSGKITARLVERAAYRSLAASKQPDSRTVNESGSGHGRGPDGLFTQVLAALSASRVGQALSQPDGLYAAGVP